MSVTVDPLREAEELREQLSSGKRRLLLFFGAGTSQAAGIDGIGQLTEGVRSALTPAQQKHYDHIIEDSGAIGNVENVLNRLRLCRELIGESTTAQINGLVGEEACDMDRTICRAIYDRVRIDPPKGFQVHSEFAAWLNSVQRERPPEIFTTNYDLLIERGLEIAEVPHFDGFIGTVSPYFSAAACDIDEEIRPDYSNIPRTWTRLWKLHGSIGWRYATEVITGVRKVVRSPIDPSTSDDLMIFPSREKYSDSRRLPFVALHDRLRRITSSGECLLLVAGYSFSDQHINDIIFSNLRSNNRLSVTVLLYDSLKNAEIAANLLQPAQGMQNLTVYAPDMALIGGTLGTWSRPPEPPEGVTRWPFWNNDTNLFALGDFANLPTFLKEFIGARTLAGIKQAAS